MSKEIKSVRVSPVSESGDVKFTLYEHIGSKYSVEVTPLKWINEPSVVTFEYHKKGIWENFTDDQFILDAISNFAIQRHMYLKTQPTNLPEVDPKKYYEITQDPWNDIAPSYRKFGIDPYDLNNGAKVYIKWKAFPPIHDSLIVGGISWSDINGKELEIERGYTQSVKTSITKTVTIVFDNVDDSMKEKFTIDKNGLFSSNALTIDKTTGLSNQREYFGNILDSDILDTIITHWRSKVTNYGELDIFDIKKFSFQGFGLPMGGVVKYISPLDPSESPPVLSPVLPDVIPTSANLVTGSSSKIKLTVVFPEEFVVNAREDVPEFKIYLGDVPSELIEGFISEESDDEFLDPEYSESGYVGEDEEIQVALQILYATGDESSLGDLTPAVKAKVLSAKAKNDAYDSSTSGTIKNPSSQQDFWTLVAICSREDGNEEAWCDIAQSIYNRIGSKSYNCSNITQAVTTENQFQPTWSFPKKTGVNKANIPNAEWKRIKDVNSAAIATEHTVEHLKYIAKILKDKTRQKSSATFIGGRTDFFGVGQAAKNMTKNGSKIQRNSKTNQFGYSWGYQAKVVYSPPAIVDSINIG